MNKWLIFFFLALLLPAVATADVTAGAVTKMVMPGPLIEGHAKFEGDCKRCHELFSEEFQRKLCLDCHKLVAADIKAGQGFHGKSKDVGQSECRVCHTDHKGRELDIVLLDVEIFDHRNADFELKDAHLQVQCNNCHNSELIKTEILNKAGLEKWELHKHRNAPDQCIDCHKKVAPHQGNLGEKCQDCHQPKQWSAIGFKHEKTKYQLEGVHRKVSCSLCHPNQRWKKTPRDCYSCHRLSDSHAGRNGKKCEICHTPAGLNKNDLGRQQSPWKRVKFNHNKTRFPLQDKHLKVQCKRCHPGPIYNQKLPLSCVSCHQAEELHRGRYGNKCEGCHKPTSWKKVKYEHEKTRFPLQDKHQKVACNKCHTGPTNGKKLSTDCYNCHDLDDAHRGQQGKTCDNCHNQRGWRADVRFEHDLTLFPLIGLHAIAPCEGCHFGATFKNTPRDCIACHKKADEHKQRLGDKCAYCHNPNGWDLWQYDHNTQSRFQLDGAHAALECLACHREPVKEKISKGKTCAGCHRGDDIHRGEFGRNCDRCHLTTVFNQIRITR